MIFNPMAQRRHFTAKFGKKKIKNTIQKDRIYYTTV